MELINKAAVVAEVERVLNSYHPTEITSGKYALKNLRSFLDTLEVKEIDLKNAVCKWLDDNCDDAGYFDQLEFAKHFFELGLKTHKR